ncbi:sugar transporter [Penicillium alfredii]|uniref:Sugar transporter n=1 Tax=Penicillium alfredii TaxID=1506179 RepID=A0A9W9GA92_9EURO|nr:sugar transporter [Penicillium alfredii]KAJ5114814.1 sugar transporter [Penicillium alfredii]
MTWQLYVTFGIFLGFSANLAVVNTGIIKILPFSSFLETSCSSPRWLIKKGRYEEAFRSLCKLRFTELQAARDLYATHVQFVQEKSIIAKGENPLSRFRQLFAVPRIRRANLAASTTLLAAGFCFWIPGDTGSSGRLAPLALFIFLFAAIYTPGEGPAVFVNALGSTILSLTFPWMRIAFTPTGAFGFYCGLNIVAFFMIFFWVPETKELTLEELDYVFAVPIAKFMKYQVKVAFPYFCERWILWRKDAKLSPLYDFSETRVVTYGHVSHSDADPHPGIKIDDV